MDKDHIIREIQRTAKANGGVAIGRKRFEQETGIGYYDWYGRHWTRWEDAVREAGVEPSRMNEASDKEFLPEHLALLKRRVGGCLLGIFPGAMLGVVLAFVVAAVMDAMTKRTGGPSDHGAGILVGLYLLVVGVSLGAIIGGILGAKIVARGGFRRNRKDSTEPVAPDDESPDQRSSG
jgi:tetrahydromethanopterin S-methyltransferase subunit G